MPTRRGDAGTGSSRASPAPSRADPSLLRGRRLRLGQPAAALLRSPGLAFDGHAVQLPPPRPVATDRGEFVRLEVGAPPECAARDRTQRRIAQGPDAGIGVLEQRPRQIGDRGAVLRNRQPTDGRGAQRSVGPRAQRGPVLLRRGRGGTPTAFGAGTTPGGPGGAASRAACALSSLASASARGCAARRARSSRAARTCGGRPAPCVRPPTRRGRRPSWRRHRPARRRSAAACRCRGGPADRAAPARTPRSRRRGASHARKRLSLATSSTSASASPGTAPGRRPPTGGRRARARAPRTPSRPGWARHRTAGRRSWDRARASDASTVSPTAFDRRAGPATYASNARRSPPCRFVPPPRCVRSRALSAASTLRGVAGTSSGLPPTHV